MYRKQDWTPDWDDGSGRLKVVSSPQAENTVEPGPDAAEAAPDRSLPNAAAEARAPSPTPPPAANAPALSAASGTDRTRRLSGRKIAFGALAALAVGGAAWFGYDWWTVGRFTVSTDDAYVGAYNTTLAAKVPGYVAQRSGHRQQQGSCRRRDRHDR